MKPANFGAAAVLLFHTPTKYGSDWFRKILVDHWLRRWDYRQEEIPADQRAWPQSLPQAPPALARVFKIRRPVEWRHIDPAQHVNNTMYMAYIEDGGGQVAAAHGWSMDRMIAAGFGIVARRYRIEYKQPALLGDELEIATWISNVKRSTVLRHYTITRTADNTLLARAQVLWVWVNLQNGRPIRLPADFLAAFATNISS